MSAVELKDWTKVGDDTVELLRRYLRIDTTNPPGNELAAANYIAGVLRKENINAEVLELAPGRGAVVARLQAGPLPDSSRALLLVGHLDVVGVDPAKWTVNAFSGTVKDANGRPVAGAKLDVWQAGADGFYDSQKGNAMNLRGIFRADAKGRFHFRCVRPEFYPVPHDGPVGRMLRATGRHPMRPPHLHFWITARGYKPLITHLFVRGGKYLDSDAVFGVKPELIIDFKKGRDGVAAVHYDFVLMRN